MTTNDETAIPEYVLRHYWGEPWASRGIYPEWSRYTDEQQQEIRELLALIEQAVLAARIDTLNLITSRIEADEKRGKFANRDKYIRDLRVEYADLQKEAQKGSEPRAASHA